MFSIFSKNNINSVSVRDLDAKLGKINLIDVRRNDEYNSGHVPTAKNIPMDTILETPEKYLNKTDEYHIICQSGARSLKTCKELADIGYKVVNVSGGTGSYIKPLQKEM